MTLNAHGSRGAGPGLLEDAHSRRVVDRWRDGYCSYSDPTADVFRSSERVRTHWPWCCPEPRRTVLEKRSLFWL